MFAWIMGKIWEILLFMVIVTAVFGGYKIIKTIILEGTDSMIERIQDWMTRKEIDRIIKKRLPPR